MKIERDIYWQEKLESGLKTKRAKPLKTRVIVRPDKKFIDQSLTSIRITGEILDSSYQPLIGKRIGVEIRLNERIDLLMIKNLKGINKLYSPTKIVITILDITGYLIAYVTDKIEIVKERYLSTEELLSGKETVEKEIEDIRKLTNVEDGIKVLAYNVGVKNIAKRLNLNATKIEGYFDPNITGVINVLKVLVNNRKIENKVAREIEYYNLLNDTRITNKIIYGEEALESINYGIVKTLLISKKIAIQKEVIERIKELLDKCLNVEIVDERTSIGMLVNKFGGIVGITY